MSGGLWGSWWAYSMLAVLAAVRWSLLVLANIDNDISTKQIQKVSVLSLSVPLIEGLDQHKHSLVFSLVLWLLPQVTTAYQSSISFPAAMAAWSCTPTAPWRALTHSYSWWSSTWPSTTTPSRLRLSIWWVRLKQILWSPHVLTQYFMFVVCFKPRILHQSRKTQAWKSSRNRRAASASPRNQTTLTTRRKVP